MNDATSHTGAARWRRVGAFVLPVVGLLLLSGCGGPFPQSAMRPAGEMAENLQDLFELILWLAIGVFVIVEGALLVAIFRYRAKRQDAEMEGEGRGLEGEPVFVHGNTLLELAWTLAPALVLVLVAVPTMTTIWEVDRFTTDVEALQVEVIAHQWWWEFRYPEYDLVTANEVHVPVGRTIDFRLTSADVIHSFWFPRQGGKRDMIPGHENHLWFRADSIGRFPGQCAEFCGLSHALMKMEIVVQSEEDFAAWVEAQTQPSPVLQAADVPTDTAVARRLVEQDTMPDAAAEEAPDDEAEQEAEAPPDTADAADASPQDAELARIVDEGSQLLMTKGCIACHTIQGTPARGVLGPNLSHVGSRRTIAAGILENNTENMIRWLRNPPGVKPGALMPALQMTDEELRTLAAYLGSLE